jgi:metallo-beta-lactamase class B
MRRYAIAMCVALTGAGVIARAQSGRDALERHLAAAREAAGYEHADLYDHLCARLLVGPSMGAGRTPQPDNYRSPKNFHAEPVKVFDNLYYLGETFQTGVSPSAWALTTSDGIVLIDSLYEDSVEDEIVGGLKKLGLNPADIKYVILTHAHGDHIGGARYLQDHFRARVIMSAIDWDTLDSNASFRGARPTKDMVATDGQKIAFGDTTITFYVTPGHTPGTFSLLIPVKDGGRQHLAFIWGGTGMQFSASSYRRQAERMRDVVDRAGADVLLSTHPQLDRSDIKLRLVEKRKPGEPHPYVIGNALVKRYVTVAAECAAAAESMPHTTSSR